MSRTIGYNPDPTPNARRDSKGRFRIEVRVMEAMLAIVGHSQCVTPARCGLSASPLDGVGDSCHTVAGPLERLAHSGRSTQSEQCAVPVTLPPMTWLLSPKRCRPASCR